MPNIALITGASSGIGADLAREHARRKGDVILVARREDRLKQLADELKKDYAIEAEVLPADLSDPETPARIVGEIERYDVDVDVLINNAGFGGHGRFVERPWTDDRDMIQVNITALADLTRHLLPAMVKRKYGRVMNVASMAGFLPGPLQAVYYASKAFVVSFTEAVAEELRDSPVTVTALCPGPVETEFFEVAGLQEKKFFRKAAKSTDVAHFGYEAMEKGQVIAIPTLANRFALQSLRVAPRSFVRKMSRRMMED